MTLSLSYREWQCKAACKGPHALGFYPPDHFERREEKRRRERRAKAICSSCSVNRECLEYAINCRELHGIWGGTTENERRELIALSY